MRAIAAKALLACVALAAVLALAGRASAAPSVNLQGVDGLTVTVRVWVDLYNCDPVTVQWGDGAQESRYYGGSFADEWTHTYAAPGDYTITATENLCPGTSTGGRSVSVGGAGSLFDPSSPMFVPVLLSIILAFVALALANAKPTVPRPSPATAPPGPRPVPQPRLIPGMPANMTVHLVRLYDVPAGAPMQFDPLTPPRIEMVPGQPTDVFQRVPCQFGCGGQLGYTAEGWFCMNPACRGIGTGPGGFPR